MSISSGKDGRPGPPSPGAPGPVGMRALDGPAVDAEDGWVGVPPGALEGGREGCDEPGVDVGMGPSEFPSIPPGPPGYPGPPPPCDGPVELGGGGSLGVGIPDPGPPW